MDSIRPLSSEYKVEIPVGVILSFVTCGIYNVLWNKKQFEAMNILLGKKEYQFGLWLLLSILTCGLFHVYYEYKMGSDLASYLTSHGAKDKSYLPLLGLLLSCVGMTVIADAIYQQEINQLVQ